MNRNAIILALTLVLACRVPSSQASLSNGDFSSNLDAWTSSGNVSESAGAALLGDDDATHSILYQPVAWPVASFTLEFDFRNELSSDTPQGNFPDVFFATIYQTDVAGPFDPQQNTFNDAIGLFDLDASGPYNVTGVISPSNLGNGWSHYAVTFPNASAYIIPYFELQDLNFNNADSAVRIDNVRLVVPEPGTLGLGIMGALMLVARTRAARRHHRA